MNLYQVAFEGVRKYVEERDEETTKVRRRRQLGITRGEEWGY